MFFILMKQRSNEIENELLIDAFKRFCGRLKMDSMAKGDGI